MAVADAVIFDHTMRACLERVPSDELLLNVIRVVVLLQFCFNSDVILDGYANIFG